MQLYVNEMFKMICKYMDEVEDFLDFYDFVKQVLLIVVKNGNYKVLVEIIRFYLIVFFFEYLESVKVLFYFVVEF